MLPRAEAPARRLPYTTADMSERLAKRKAEQDAATNAQLAGSVLGPGITRDAQGNIYANGQKVDWSKSVAPTAVPSFNKGTVRPPDPPKGFMDNVGGLLSTAATMGKSFIPGTKESYMLADTIQKNPLSVPLSVVNSFVNTGKNIADLGQVVGGPDLGEPGINYAQAYKRGEGISMGVEDLLNVLAVGGVAKAGIAKVKPARIVDSPISPATQLVEAQKQRALPPAEIAPAIAETPASRLAPPAFRERQIPASSRLTSEIQGNGKTSAFVTIRSFNQQTGEYTGVIQLTYSAYDGTAKVLGMAATSPTVTPQLIAAAKMEIMKLGSTAQFPIDPSASLSAYSRPFVERLQQAGLIDPSYELPEVNMMNPITKETGPGTFASPFTGNQTVIDPLSYQPTYNDILKALIESKRQAKLAGETGKLNTSSKRLETLKYLPPGLNDAAAYRVNMRSLRMPEHPLLKQMSDNEFDSLMREIYTNPGSAAKKLIDMWEKIKPSEELGMWADYYANTPENLKKFPDLLKDAYLINQPTRDRLMSQLDAYLTFGEY